MPEGAEEAIYPHIPFYIPCKPETPITNAIMDIKGDWQQRVHAPLSLWVFVNNSNPHDFTPEQSDSMCEAESLVCPCELSTRTVRLM